MDRNRRLSDLFLGSLILLIECRIVKGFMEVMRRVIENELFAPRCLHSSPPDGVGIKQMAQEWFMESLIMIVLRWNTKEIRLVCAWLKCRNLYKLRSVSSLSSQNIDIKQLA